MSTIGTVKTVRYTELRGVRLFRGCLSIKVNGRTVRTFRIVRYIVSVRFSGVSVKLGSTVITMQGMLFDSTSAVLVIVIFGVAKTFLCVFDGTLVTETSTCIHTKKQF